MQDKHLYFIELSLHCHARKNKIDIKKFKNFYMQAIQPSIIIADFETSTNSPNRVKPYSFAMVTYCIYDINNNKLSHYTGNNCLN